MQRKTSSDYENQILILSYDKQNEMVSSTFLVQINSLQGKLVRHMPNTLFSEAIPSDNNLFHKKTPNLFLIDANNDYQLVVRYRQGLKLEKLIGREIINQKLNEQYDSIIKDNKIVHINPSEELFIPLTLDELFCFQYANTKITFKPNSLTKFNIKIPKNSPKQVEQSQPSVQTFSLPTIEQQHPITLLPEPDPTSVPPHTPDPHPKTEVQKREVQSLAKEQEEKQLMQDAYEQILAYEREMARRMKEQYEQLLFIEREKQKIMREYYEQELTHARKKMRIVDKQIDRMNEKLNSNSMNIPYRYEELPLYTNEITYPNQYPFHHYNEEKVQISANQSFSSNRYPFYYNQSIQSHPVDLALLNQTQLQANVPQQPLPIKYLPNKNVQESKLSFKKPHPLPKPSYLNCRDILYPSINRNQDNDNNSAPYHENNPSHSTSTSPSIPHKD